MDGVRSATSETIAAWRRPAEPGILARQREFNATLGRLPEQPTPRDDLARSREAAADLVAQALVLPILKEFRASQSSGPPFGVSEGERSFRAMLDDQIARRMARKEGWPLVESLARQLRDPQGREAWAALQAASEGVRSDATRVQQWGTLEGARP
jgi:Rod binding domain-containing protein